MASPHPTNGVFGAAFFGTPDGPGRCYWLPGCCCYETGGSTGRRRGHLPGFEFGSGPGKLAALPVCARRCPSAGDDAAERVALAGVAAILVGLCCLIGGLPEGLPGLDLPGVDADDLGNLVLPALAIALATPCSWMY